MKNAVLIVCALVALGLSQINEIDAANVQLGEIPYQVSLQIGGKHVTSGVIISDEWILASAKNIYWELDFEEKVVSVIAGTVDLREPFSTHKVVKSYFYNQIIPDGYDYEGADLAVLKVSPPFKFSSRIGKATLPEPNAIINIKSTLVISGWGFTSFDYKNNHGTATNILQKATVHVSDLEACRVAIEKIPYETLEDYSFCTTNPNVQTGVCRADYGGPVTIDGVLVAISSSSIKEQNCTDPKSPFIHTQLSKLNSWISKMSKFDHTCDCKCPCTSKNAKLFGPYDD